jgi:hypothetical protein
VARIRKASNEKSIKQNERRKKSEGNEKSRLVDTVDLALCTVEARDTSTGKVAQSVGAL